MPSPDILALQEADRHTIRAGGHDIATELAIALKMNFARAGSPTPAEEDHKKKRWYLDFEERIAKGESGDTGVALLSRLPILDPKRVDLPWSECPWRPRLAMTAAVPFGRTILRVFNAHIDPHAGLEQQLEQHNAILEAADKTDPTKPIALVGDFNTLIRRSRDATRAFLEARGFTSPQPSGLGTWRAGPLRLHADWIFVRNVTVRRWGVARRLRISDHWPIWAELEPQKA